MSAITRSRGRPTGSNRATLGSWVKGRGPFTMGQLARSLGWPLATADNSVRRAEQSGVLRRFDTMRTPECKRSVVVYVSADYDPPVDLQRVMQLWST